MPNRKVKREDTLIKKTETIEPVALVEEPQQPAAIELTADERFLDEDGILMHFPAHRPIRNPHSIKVLLDRKANYKEIK